MINLFSYSSEDVASRLRDHLRADDLGVLLLIECPVLLGSLSLHFDLDVVLADFILAQSQLRWVLDQNACVGLFDDVADDMG